MTKKLQKHLKSFPVDQMLKSVLANGLYNFISNVENAVPFTDNDLEALQIFFYEKMKQTCDLKSKVGV